MLKQYTMKKRKTFKRQRPTLNIEVNSTLFLHSSLGIRLYVEVRMKKCFSSPRDYSKFIHETMLYFYIKRLLRKFAILWYQQKYIKQNFIAYFLNLQNHLKRSTLWELRTVGGGGRKNNNNQQHKPSVHFQF